MREIDYLRTGRTGDPLGNFSVVVRLDDNGFDLLRLHLRNHLRQMRWRGGNAGFRFQKNVDLQPETVAEVGPGIVIGGDVLAFKREQGRAPLLKPGIDGGFEFLVVRVVGSGVGWVDCRK